MLLSRFEVELDKSMGGVEGMLERQCNTFTVSIDKARSLAHPKPIIPGHWQAPSQQGARMKIGVQNDTTLCCRSCACC